MARAQIALVLTSILSVAWCSREEGLDTSTMLQVSAPPDAVAHAGADGHDRRTPRVMGSARDLTLQIGETAGICHTVFLTSVFTAWGNERRETPSLRFFERYYRAMTSLASGGPGAVVLYDDLPMDIVRNFSDDAVSFQKVDISGFDPKMSLDELRYSVFEEAIKKHSEWKTIFMTDIRDAVVLRDPCPLVAGHADKLFAGSRPARLNLTSDEQLAQSGGNYLTWDVAQSDSPHLELNPVVLGGRRPVVLKALGKVRELSSDSQLAAESRSRADRSSASAIHYAADSALGKDKVMAGVPLHSKLDANKHRADVYFWCK